MRILFSVVLAALVSLGLSACGSTANVKLNPKIATAIPDKTSFVLKDARPDAERVSSISGGSAGETRSYGDDTLTPPVPDLLKAWLHNKLSAELAGKQVTLEQFSVSVLDPAIVIAPNTAPGTALLVKGLESMFSQKIVYVRVGGKVGAEEFYVKESANFQGRVAEQNVEATLTRALDMAVEDIRRAAAK
ncbi:hypothetical protein [Polaromonas sp.]|uniref:hypothetical protein n=1 Tax=Polaromonas sp. TaxID=1869339 RepID=UPI003BACEEE4